MLDKPVLTLDTVKRMSDMSWFTHAKIFDDLLIVAQKETACYVWKTSAGLVVIDGIWPDERVYREIIAAIEEAGWDPADLCAFVMTHGHIDHVGCGSWLVENHHVKTYLSEADDVLRKSSAEEEGRPTCWQEFEIDHYLQDGEEIEFGDKTLRVVATPGHTDGCMSFLFQVREFGWIHIASLFGGATPPWNDEAGKETQRESIRKFMNECERKFADVALTTHTAFDNGLERIAYSKVRMQHLPNIYIVGEMGVRMFMGMYENVAE